jgi:hypothetical protein
VEAADVGVQFVLDHHPLGVASEQVLGGGGGEVASIIAMRVTRSTQPPEIVPQLALSGEALTASAEGQRCQKATAGCCGRGQQA